MDFPTSIAVRAARNGEQGHREYNAGAMRLFVLLAIPRSGLANKSKARRGVARRRSQPRGVKGLRVLQ
jgi:hypothetical protein